MKILLLDLWKLCRGKRDGVAQLLQAANMDEGLKRNRVEFSFADGSLDYGPNSVPFPGGTFATVVASGEEATVAWTGSGLSFVTSK